MNNSVTVNALASALSLLKRIYIESEINDDAVVYITNDRFVLTCPRNITTQIYDCFIFNINAISTAPYWGNGGGLCPIISGYACGNRHGKSAEPRSQPPARTAYCGPLPASPGPVDSPEAEPAAHWLPAPKR